MKSWGAGLAVVCFFVFGFYISLKTKQFPFEPTEFDGQVTRRDPAAIKRVYDFSHLEGSALSYASKNRLLSGARIIKDEESIGLQLGHFVIRSESGQKVFACDRYNSMTLVFQGDGSAMSGQFPVMEVEGACKLGQDINSISALMIPVRRILGETVAEGEFDFRDTYAVRISFGNVADQWPTVWKLVAVKLYDNEQPEQSVFVSPDEIDQYHKKPVILDFQSR